MRRRYTKIVNPDKAPSPTAWSGPSLYLPIKTIPEAKDWKIGETYYLSLKVEQESLSQDSVTFSIKGVAVENENES